MEDGYQLSDEPVVSSVLDDEVAMKQKYGRERPQRKRRVDFCPNHCPDLQVDVCPDCG